MNDIEQLLAKNRAWAASMTAAMPDFFQQLALQQKPDYLWIGCADSRVPATQLVDLLPGEMFVHRNVANVVVHSDLNFLSVLQFAVDVLQVKHIIVCGHYGCGGVQAAFRNSKLGLIDNWLRHVQDVRHKYDALLATCADEQQQLDRLCELNVIEQVANVCQTTIVQNAWERGQHFAVHGLIYSVADGLLKDLELQITDSASLGTNVARSIAGLGA